MAWFLPSALSVAADTCSTRLFGTGGCSVMVGEHGDRLGEFHCKTALVILCHGGLLGLVAPVEEGEVEGPLGILEDIRVLRPVDYGPRRHDRGQVARDESLPRQVRQRDHFERRFVGPRRSRKRVPAP